MKLTLKEVADLVGGTLNGAGDKAVTGVAGLGEAGPEDVTFLIDAKRASELASTKAACAIVGKGVAANGALALIEVAGHPQIAFAKVLSVLERERRPLPRGVHPAAVVHPSAVLGKDVSVGACAVVEAGARVGDGTVLYAQSYVGADAVVGKDCILYPQVVVRERCRLGDRVILHPGAVIGADGYAYVMDKGVHHKIPQVGVVVLEDDVELGANVCVDRAALGETRIGAGTKVDNLVQIGHNCKIGPANIIVSQVGISGSVTSGHHVMMLGQAGVGDHVTIGDEAAILGQAGVAKDVPAKAVVNGTPARPFREQYKLLSLIARLPDLFDDVKKLKSEKETQKA